MSKTATFQDFDAKGGEGMRVAAVRGAFWNIAMAMGNKVVTTAGQVALAWYLLPRDMGVVTMAASVAAWATFFTASGMDDLLVQRHDTYESDAPQIFWLCLVFNLLALAVAVCLTPFASRHFADHRVGNLMLIQAASWPLTSIVLVLRPKLANLLRFKAIAVTQFGQGFILTVSAVLLAAWGWGPYALVWPIFFSVCFSALVFLCLSGRLPLERPRPSRWKVYLAPGMMLMFGNFVSVMAVQVPNFIVGSFFLDETRTGLYAWGYMVASQAVFLLVLNLRGVFTPLFSKLKDEPLRLAEVTAKSAYLITALVAPICLLQAFLARPLITAFFPQRWVGAVDVVFWLSLGFCAQPIALVAQSALIAVGRFGQALRLSLLQAVLIALGVAWGCVQGGVESAAIGASIASLLCLPAYLWVLHYDLSCAWARLLDALKSVAYSAAAFLAPWALGLVLGRSSWWCLGLELLSYVGALALLYRLFDPGLLRGLQELWTARAAAKSRPGSVPVPAQ